jgi:transcriptional regulator with XRE-family HTH domain
VTFAEKIVRWIAEKGVSRAALAKTAKIGPSVLNNYVKERQSSPMAENALRLSRAMQVPLDWLVDNSRDWPPPAQGSQGSIESQLINVPLSSLLHELARRYRLDTLDVLPDLVEAQETDWSKVFAEAKDLAEGEPIPQSLARELQLLGKISSGVLAVLVRYDVHIAADFRHHELPGADRPPETLSYVATISAFSDLFQNSAFASVFSWLLMHKKVMEKLRIPAPFSPGQLFSVLDEANRRKLLSLSQTAKKE